MKCRNCGVKAQIYLRSFNLPLCKDHFVERYIDTVKSTISKFKMFSKDDKILVAASGGKDSMALWHLLLKLGYKVTALYINLGIESEKGESGYSNASEKVVREFAEKMGADLIIENVLEKYGTPAPLLDRRRAPCSACGIAKRHIFNHIAMQTGYGIVATGHNLDDEVTALLGNALRWDETYFKSQYPVLPAEDGFAKKVKPLVFITEKENLAFCMFENIPFHHDECPFSHDSISIALKRIWAQIEDLMPGAKYRFFKEFLRLKEKYFKLEEKKIQGKCKVCNQPTLAGDLCAFHRMVDRIKIKVINEESLQQSY